MARDFKTKGVSLPVKIIDDWELMNDIVDDYGSFSNFVYQKIKENMEQKRYKNYFERKGEKHGKTNKNKRPEILIRQDSDLR